MCNIAGYVGSRPAAPILLDMMKRQEGFAGGYFSGMATIHDGRLYHAKLTGDVARLESLTDVASFPGTIGIIHSRSNSGGGDKWAHPFTRSKNGQVTEAYIANGGLGCSKPRLPEYCQLGQRLMDEGYTMPSRDNVPNTIYPTLADGSVIHMSDIMCQLIARNLDRGRNLLPKRLPGPESICLCLWALPPMALIFPAHLLLSLRMWSIFPLWHPAPPVRYIRTILPPTLMKSHLTRWLLLLRRFDSVHMIRFSVIFAPVLSR